MNWQSCSGPHSRRWFLQLGTLGLSGLCLADVMQLRAAAGEAKDVPDTSVILLWLAGGPPHLDMYDMKPDAPEEYRGPFQPIATNVSGRNHWHKSAASLLSGGGLPMGQVIGQSTRDGGQPATEPMTIAHLYATIFHTLFDVGQLRIQQGLSRDVLKIATAAEPITGLSL
ncbi:MAG: DUF1501 domain-containing protein [Planctomycetota bacterium]